MNETRALSLAFMRSHPAQAARVLEALPADEASGLFEAAPARLGADVLAAMLPVKAARCLALLPDGRALELLAPMATQPTVALLRHVPEPRRRTLTAGLPTASALASSLLLGFGEDTLGAWADPDVLLLGDDTLAGDALARLRASAVRHPQVYVVDAGRRLTGVVALLELLDAPPSTPLAPLMAPPPPTLAAHAPLSGALHDAAWERGSVLPVVEPGERLVGVISRDALERALRRLEPPPTPAADGSLTRLAALGYWQALSGLLGAGLGLLPPVPPLAPAPGGPPAEAPR